MASFLTKILEIIFPRACTVCGNRLMPDESCVCCDCLKDIPYTDYYKNPTGNELARLFWKKFPIEKAAALFFYNSHAEYINIIYKLKYHNQPEIGNFMGEYSVRWLRSKKEYNFFEDIDYIIPVPLAKKRLHQRGYNQSELIARGMANATGIPILTNAVIRTKFKQSQTRLSVWERNENVENTFLLSDNTWTEKLKGKHILLIDDIITTGATITSCAQPLSEIEGIKISIFTLGYANS